MNECNGGPPRKLRMCLNRRKRPSGTALQERISEKSEAIKVPKISRQRSVEVVNATPSSPPPRGGFLRGCATRSAENNCSVTSSGERWNLQHTTMRVLAEVNKTFRRKRISEGVRFSMCPGPRAGEAPPSEVHSAMFGAGE